MQQPARRALGMTFVVGSCRPLELHASYAPWSSDVTVFRDSPPHCRLSQHTVDGPAALPFPALPHVDPELDPLPLAVCLVAI